MGQEIFAQSPNTRPKDKMNSNDTQVVLAFNYI